ncbi:MAG: YfhO family protein, partial [Oscillospiraceae bacterium]
MKKVIMFSAFSALAAGAILTIFYIINGISPFGENLILRNDALYQYNPLLVEFAERVKDGSSLLFSWQSGFGINFFGTILYYLVNPFNFISLFFSADNMPTAFAIIILCSTMLISATTAIYLQKSFKKSDLSVIIFSLCYTFCGFYLANYYNIMWLTCFAMLPLIALGIDKITKGEKPFVYCISLSFAIISNFYLGFMLCIFSVLYFFTRLFSNPVNKKGEERVKKEKLLPVVFKFGLFSLLSGGISAISLIPTMYSMNNSYFKNSFTFEGSHFFEVLDFFKVHVSGVVTNQMNPTEMALPAVAICTIILLLVPLFFFAKKIPINEKIAHAVLLGIFVVSFEIPKVYYAWHGLSAPAGLPYRFAFIYSFILVMMAYKAFINLNDMPKWAIGVAAVLPIFCIATNFIDFKKEYLTATIVAMVATVVFVAIIALLQNVKKGSKAITAIALTCVIAEIIGVNYQKIGTTEKSDY